MEAYKEEWKRNSWCLVSFASNHTDTRWTSLNAQLHTCKHTHKEITKCAHTSTSSHRCTHTHTSACEHTHKHAHTPTVMTWLRTLDMRYYKITQSQFGVDIWQVRECNGNDKHLTVPLFCFPQASWETKGKSKAHNYHVWHERQVDNPALSVARWNSLSPPSWQEESVCCSVLIKVGVNWHFTNSAPQGVKLCYFTY